MWNQPHPEPNALGGNLDVGRSAARGTQQRGGSGGAGRRPGAACSPHTSPPGLPQCHYSGLQRSPWRSRAVKDLDQSHTVCRWPSQNAADGRGTQSLPLSPSAKVATLPHLLSEVVSSGLVLCCDVVAPS